MKIAFLVTSTIEVDNTNNFIYQPHLKRSCWNTEQRLEQTLFTVSQIKKIVPTADIYILDSSRNFQLFQNKFLDANYIPLYKLDKNTIEITHNNKIKGLCETILVDTFLNTYKKQIENYDYIVKITGRYFITESFELDILNEFNLDKILTKGVSWVDIENFKNTGYELFLNSNNKFPYVLTCLYAVGKYKFNFYHVGIKKIIQMYQEKNIDDVALETVFYENILLNYKDYYYVPWKIQGYCGVTGQLVYY